MSTPPKTFLTADQYLEIERAAEYKSEYFKGEMFAMAGAREAHNLLVTNIVGDEPDETIALDSVGVHLRLADLYEKVEFAA